LLAAETPLEGPAARHEALGLLAAVHPALAAGARGAAAIDAAAAGLRALGVPAGDPLARFLLAALAGRAERDVDAVLARLGMGGAPARRLAAEARRLPALAARLASEPAAAPRALHDALAGA